MVIENMTLEVTRKCNMKCAHCLRGGAQNKKMGYGVIDSILSRVDTINTITFTGGEPTLALDVIKHFIDSAVMHGTSVGNFYIVTNGKVFKQELVDIIGELSSICTENDLSGLAVSDDMFHSEFRTGYEDATSIKWRYQYALEAICLDDCLNMKDKKRDNGYDGLISRGRAKYIGTRHQEPLDCLKFNTFPNPNIITGEFYVTVDGNVVGDANLSYNQMKSQTRGNVFDWDGLLDGIRQSTIDNYKWCKSKCNSFESCTEYDDICDIKDMIFN